MEDFKHSPRFESATPRGERARYLLLAGIVVSALSVMVSLFQIRKLSGLPGDGPLDGGEGADVGLLDFAVLGAGLAQIVVSLTTIVLFLMWIHRAYRNLKPLRAKGLQYSPGWAVGAWFIPFANLFIPFRITRELWSKSDVETAEFGFLSSDSAVPSFFGYWWACWVASNIATNFSTRLSFRAETVAQGLGATWLSLIAELLSIPAALFAMRVISAINARQSESRRRLPQSPYPPPPTYETANS
jgi:hypothetical protein